MKTYKYQSRNIYIFKENLSLVNKYIIQFNIERSQAISRSFLDEVSKRCKHRGSLDTISWLKDIRTQFYAYLGGYTVEIRHLSVTKDGIPRGLATSEETRNGIRKGDIKTIRFLLTLLQVSRFLEGQKDPDYSPITDHPTYSAEIRKEFGERCKMALNELQLGSVRQHPKWTVPHFTSKGSPSGPAMLSVKHDLDHNSESSVNSMGVVAGGRLTEYMDRLRSQPSVFKTTRECKPDRKGRLRSLGLVEDTEGKTRVIAMADYWTQTSLLPLHQDLLSVLRKLGDKDLTFGQDIKPFGIAEHSYYSFDLTSATDRLPRFLYVDVLSNLYGENYSLEWEKLMVELGYHGSDGIVRKYNTGQPMGLYSSWPLLALVHHTIVQIAGLRVGLRRFSDYRILGDDIVIRHDEVARQYQEILRQLGVGISKTKTLVSKDTFEFAKRLFYKDEEVTAFPVHGIAVAVVSGWQELYSVLETASKRNFGSLLSLVMPRVIEGIYRANASAIHLHTLTKEERKEITINRGFHTASRAKVRRLGRVGAKFCGTFYILSTATRPEPTFKWVCDQWRLNVGCTTNTKLVLEELTNRYLVELTSELQSSYYKTLDQLEKYYGLEEYDVEDALYDIPDFLKQRLVEPLAWAMLDQAQRIKDTDLQPSPDPEDTLHLEAWAEALKRANVRILDPKIFDRSRKFERVSRLKSSCATKAFAREAVQLFKLLPPVSRADKH